MSVQYRSLRDDENVICLPKQIAEFVSWNGILNEESLRDVEKKQNKVEEYKEFFHKLNKKGILTFTGFMFALDEDTPNTMKHFAEVRRSWS